MPDYFKMTPEARADVVADTMLNSTSGSPRGSTKWTAIHKAALRMIREAVLQDREERSAQ